MELNAELLSLQSTLRNVEKSTGDFAKIRYIDGNEEHIEKIFKAIQFHMIQHEESDYKKKFLEFLIVNTNLENNTLTVVKEYQHLINVIPTLSTCLLANIMVDLELLEAYSSVMTTISLKENKHILFQLKICLKRLEMLETLKYTYTVLTAVINLFSSNDQNSEGLDRIADIFKGMLGNLSEFNPDKVKDWTLVRLQEHMGYTLLHILKLINQCTTTIERLLDSLINSAATIMKTVTINVFIAWAEVNYKDGTPLQLIIAEEAYISIERLQKYKPASALIQMLSAIAKKPKTLTEKILVADLQTIINNVNGNENDRAQWFRALINTNVFDNEEAIKCVEKWRQLCTYDDLSRLFYSATSSKYKHRVFTCAYTLSLDDLKSAIMQYFWKYPYTWNDDIENKFIILFNKGPDESEAFLKEVCLLLVQNREMLLRTLYINCLNSLDTTRNYKILFRTIKELVHINNVARDVFINVFQSNLVTSENFVAYKELINTLIELSYFTRTVVINNIFKPQLNKLTENDTSLNCTLKLLNSTHINFVLDDDAQPIVILLLELMEKYRKSLMFLDKHFDNIVCIDLLSKFEENGPYPDFKDRLDKLELSPMNRFHVSKLCGEVADDKILRYIFGSWNVGQKAEAIAMLLKVLPVSFKTEWILISKEIDSESDYQTTLNLFNSFLFILCEIGSSVESLKERQTLLTCLTIYLSVIKEVLQPKHNTLQEERVLVKSMCALLKDLPSDVRKIRFMGILGLLSDEALKSLKDDREFVLSLVAIQDVNVSQLLAQKVLS